MVGKGHGTTRTLFFDIISIIKPKPTTFIVLDIELPFKCTSEDFGRIYQEQYKGRISHGFIRNKLGLPGSVRLKLNGTFQRKLYLLDVDDCIYEIKFRVQTAVWHNIELDKWQYVSIFPNFIKRYCPPCLHMLEYISCQIGEGENVFWYIDDPEEILDCEDRIVRPMRRLEKQSTKSNYPALLNSRYTDVYNKPLAVSDKESKATRRFSILFNLVLTARKFFGRQHGTLSLLNTVIPL